MPRLLIVCIFAGNGLLKIGNFAGTEYYHHRQLPVGDQVPSNLHSQFECEPIHFDFTNVSCFAGGKITEMVYVLRSKLISGYIIQQEN